MYIIFGFTESIAIELTALEGYPVSILVHAEPPIPPVVDFHNPPDAEPINNVAVSVG
jgi:hypothetical protein